MSPAARRWMAQPGLALATTARRRDVARAIAASLRSPDGAGQLGLERAVGAAGPAAQAVVVELDHVGRRGASTVRTAAVGPLDVAQVAGVLDDDRGQASRHRRQAVDPLGQPLVDVEHAGAEAAAPRPCRAGGRSPSARRRSRPSRPGSARRRGTRRMTRLASRRAWPLEAGVDVQGAAAVARPGPGARRRRPVASITWMVATWIGPQPRVHHAAGEQPDVGPGRPQRRPAQRQRRQAEALRHQADPLGDGQRPRAGQHQPVVAEGPVGEPLPPGRSPGGGGPACVRVPSMSRPKGTPDGQAVSQPRHCTQVSMKSTNSPSGGAPSHWTARMAAMRPRGESRLLARHPVRRAVGQAQAAADAGRQLVVDQVQVHPPPPYPVRPPVHREPPCRTGPGLLSSTDLARICRTDATIPRRNGHRPVARGTATGTRHFWRVPVGDRSAGERVAAGVEAAGRVEAGP